MRVRDWPWSRQSAVLAKRSLCTATEGEEGERESKPAAATEPRRVQVRVGHLSRSRPSLVSLAARPPSTPLALPSPLKTPPAAPTVLFPTPLPFCLPHPPPMASGVYSKGTKVWRVPPPLRLAFPQPARAPPSFQPTPHPRQVPSPGGASALRGWPARPPPSSGLRTTRQLGSPAVLAGPPLRRPFSGAASARRARRACFCARPGERDPEARLRSGSPFERGSRPGSRLGAGSGSNSGVWPGGQGQGRSSSGRLTIEGGLPGVRQGPRPSSSSSPFLPSFLLPPPRLLSAPRPPAKPIPTVSPPPPPQVPRQGPRLDLGRGHGARRLDRPGRARARRARLCRRAGQGPFSFLLLTFSLAAF